MENKKSFLRNGIYLVLTALVFLLSFLFLSFLYNDWHFVIIAAIPCAGIYGAGIVYLVEEIRSRKQ